MKHFVISHHPGEGQARLVIQTTNGHAGRLPRPSRKGKVLLLMTDLAPVTTTSPSVPLDPSGPESMVHITPVAAAKVNEIRDAEGIEGNMALRLRVVGGGCAGFSYDLYFDEPAEVVDRPHDGRDRRAGNPAARPSRSCRAPGRARDRHG